MFHVVIVVEDTTLTAHRGEQKWRVRIVDTFSGKSGETEWTDLELAAVQFLMLANDPSNDKLDGDFGLKWFYAIAERLFKDMPSELRCIP